MSLTLCLPPPLSLSPQPSAYSSGGSNWIEQWAAEVTKHNQENLKKAQNAPSPGTARRALPQPTAPGPRAPTDRLAGVASAVLARVGGLECEEILGRVSALAGGLLVVGGSG